MVDGEVRGPFLRDQIGIAHATRQVEPRTGSGCSELDW
jgi:hypothetical protein